MRSIEAHLRMTHHPDLLARSVEEYLASSAQGIIVEEGQILFDLSRTRYSITAERGKCLLHLWSEERNVVREVVDGEVRNGSLRLSVRRFAQARPHALQVLRERDQRTQTERKTARSHYAQVLEAVLRREFPGCTLDRISTSMNLERSLSPVYARGLLRQGQGSIAVLGVNPEESQASVDGALTFGLLWMDNCRRREAGRSMVKGLRIYAPLGRSSTLQLRMAHLNHQAAQFHLLELDEQGGLTEKNCTALHSFESRLMPCPQVEPLHRLFAKSIEKILALSPETDIAILSPTEIAFRLYGLEFARARMAALPGSFQAQEEIVFGIPGMEHRLSQQNEAFFAEFVTRVTAHRMPFADRRNPIWRMYPERWLESLLVKDISKIDSHLDDGRVYSQVPAFSASDRSLIDVLTCTREERLAVVELKADEDIHLPVQGIDYWARVRRHHEAGDFQKYGYFAGISLSPQPPLLFLVAPSLRVHPSIETILRYFSPEICWNLVGINESWREGIKTIYRRAAKMQPFMNAALAGD